MSLTKPKGRSFQSEVLKITIPVTLQYVFQALLSFINQLMVGQLGDVSVAANGLGNVYANLFTITITAISTSATILISQHYGRQDRRGVSTSFFFTSVFGAGIMILFTIVSLMFPYEIMSLYTEDAAVCAAAADYLEIIAISFIPYSLTWLISAMLRSVEKSQYPMYSGLISIFLNIIANYFLIFGKFGFPELGLKGSAIALTLSRFVECFILILLFAIWIKKNPGFVSFKIQFRSDFIKKVLIILVPIIVTEFLWVLGNNVFMMMYGRIDTTADSVAAVSLTDSIQMMATNLLIGLSTAAGVIIAKRLGRNKYNGAYSSARRLIFISFIGSLIISVLIVIFADMYVDLFKVSDHIQELTKNVLYIFAGFLFIKMLNMMLGSVIRSGGNTTYSLVVDTLGTWVIGVPLGLIATFVFDWKLVPVYICISVEEIVRLIAMFIIFKRKKWMKNLTPDKPETSELT